MILGIYIKNKGNGPKGEAKDGADTRHEFSAQADGSCFRHPGDPLISEGFKLAGCKRILALQDDFCIKTPAFSPGHSNFCPNGMIFQ